MVSKLARLLANSSRLSSESEKTGRSFCEKEFGKLRYPFPQGIGLGVIGDADYWERLNKPLVFMTLLVSAQRSFQVGDQIARRFDPATETQKVFRNTTLDRMAVFDQAFHAPQRCRPFEQFQA